jgi:hypothetical protein
MPTHDTRCYGMPVCEIPPLEGNVRSPGRPLHPA